MKNRNFSITLIVLLVCLLLASCNQSNTLPPAETTPPVITEPEAVPQHTDIPANNNRSIGLHRIKYFDGYIYLYSADSTNGKKYLTNSDFLRYNPDTGNLTYVCNDPLCDHLTVDCPIYGMMSFNVHENKIYFSKAYRRLTTQNGESTKEIFSGFCCYDLESHKLKNLAVYMDEKDTDKNFSVALNTNDLYFENYRFSYSKKKDDQSGDIVKTVERMDLISGESVAFENIQSNDGVLTPVDTVAYLFHGDGRIFFTDYKSIFSTDINLQDKKTIAEGVFTEAVYSNGEYIVWQIDDELHIMNLDGSNAYNTGIKTVSNYTGYIVLTEKYIYYRSNEQISLGTNSSAQVGGEIVLEGKDIHRYSFESKTDEIVWSFEGEYEHTRIIDQWIVLDGVIYAMYESWGTPNVEGKYTEADHYKSWSANNTNSIIKIDTNNKTVDIVEMIP